MKIQFPKPKLSIYLVIFLSLIFAAIIFYFNPFKFQKEIDTYKFQNYSFYYSENRGPANYEILLEQTNDSLKIYKIRFPSRNFLNYNITIYGLLFIPKTGKNKKFPGIVLLPGGGGTKEQESRLASKIAKLGYGVLTIDQRGIGETAGYYLNFNQDYQIFIQGKEPIQHLSVYDVLKSADVLRNFKNIDKNKIGLMGESMGGRYAIIAAALDKRLKGVIAISTSGFHIDKNSKEPFIPYLVSVDPDNYISKISPNFVGMLHGTNDSVVSLEDAKMTFSLAKEPKRFFIAENCTHGYCEKMFEPIKEYLEIMFNK